MAYDDLDLHPADGEISVLAQPENVEKRISFARCVRRALERAGYSSHRRLHQAIEARRQEFGRAGARLDVTVSYWQHFYDERRDVMRSIPLFERLLELVRVLLPAYKGRMWLLTDPAMFESATGVGSLFPPEMRLSITDAFSQWLHAGREPAVGCLDGDLSGEYIAYFPWLEAREWRGEIARARARIYFERQVWRFESSCHVEAAGPMLFAGQLRFTGSNSVLLVAFTSFPFPSAGSASAAQLLSKELLIHPYRLPSSPDSFWHGSTTFIDTSSLDYAGSVPHVMRRMSRALRSPAEWQQELIRPMPVLRSGDREYANVRGELERCSTRLPRRVERER